MHSPHNRTTDVRTREDILFSELHLPETLLKGLNEAGFINPSPIQLQAIPVGRFGIGKISCSTY
jgi:ATP-dependent RNA helicase DDX20